MLRYSQGFISSCASLGLSESLLPKLVCVQSIRWNRKPRWLPVAKSKMFRVPVRPKIPQEERDELSRLNNIYRTYFSALRHYLSQEYEKNINQYTGAVDLGGQDSEHEDCMRINAEWNAQVAAEREKRLVRQGEERKMTILQTLIAAEKRQQERVQKADEIVRKEKINSKTFITAENIDKAIEDALATETDHNYAIDLEGNVYRGRYSKPTDTPPEEREKLEVKAEATA